MKFIRAYFYLLLLTIALGVGVTFPVFAQLNFESALLGSLTLRANPSSPEPNTMVIIEASSPGNILEKSTIRWYKDGKLIESGTGKTRVSFEVGSMGSRNTIRALATTQDGVSIEQTIVVRPQRVRLLWETSAKNPYWYAGKAYPGPGGNLRIIAMPDINVDGTRIPANRLFYHWTVSGKPLLGDSGEGKQTLELILPKSPAATIRIELRVDTLDGRGSAYAVLPFISAGPQVLLYAYDPLFGTKNEQTVEMRVEKPGTEIIYIAEAFSFSVEDALNHEWKVDGRHTSPSSDSSPHILRIITDENSRGTHIVEILTSNTANLFQRASSFAKLIIGL